MTRPNQFDPTTPLGTSSPRDGDNQMRQIKLWTQNGWNDMTSTDRSASGRQTHPLYATTINTTGLATMASVDINGGNIDGTTIGASTPAVATVTTLVATTGINPGGTANLAISGGTTSGNVSITTVDGDIDISTNGAGHDVTIEGVNFTGSGSFTASGTASLTTMNVTGTSTLATVDINGGTIDGTVIGATTRAAVNATTVSANATSGHSFGTTAGGGSVTIGDYTFTVNASSGHITISTGSTNLFRVLDNGDTLAAGNVTANATIS